MNRGRFANFTCTERTVNQPLIASLINDFDIFTGVKRKYITNEVRLSLKDPDGERIVAHITPEQRLTKAEEIEFIKIFCDDQYDKSFVPETELPAAKLKLHLA